MAGKKGQGERLNMAIEGGADVIDDTQSDIVGKVALAEIQQAANGKNPDDHEGDVG